MPGILIAVGKPKGNAPPDDPDEMPTGGAKPSGNPFASKGAAKSGGMAAHEAAESPTQEGSEEYGAKLISDIEDVGNQYGIDPTQMHAMAADLFTAVAKCLGGGSKPEAPPMGGHGGGMMSHGDTGEYSA